jgi:hypothetical protein
MATKKDEEIGYAEALKELETILAELERTDVDVDVLASRVERASEPRRIFRRFSLLKKNAGQGLIPT